MNEQIDDSEQKSRDLEPAPLEGDGVACRTAPKLTLGWAFVLVIVVAFAAIRLATWSSFASPADTGREQALPLNVPREKLNFGEVWAQSGFLWTLPVTNATDQPLTIVGLVPQCRCAAIDLRPNRLTIASGATEDMTVVLDLLPTHEHLKNTSATHDMNVDFFVELENHSPARFVLEGRVRHPLQAEPSVIEYGDALTEGMPFHDVSFTVTPLCPLSDIVADCTKQVGNVSLSSPNTEGVRTGRFSPAPGLRAGSIDTDLMLFGLLSDGTLLPPTKLRIRGRVLPELRARPELLEFGMVRVGDTTAIPLTIYSARDRPFSILSLAAHSPLSSVDASPQHGTSALQHLSQISFRSTSGGQRTGELVVRARDADNVERLLSLPFTAFVRPAAE